ncbi:hypothetical protein [Mycobacterium sp. D16R24]|uniref:hypothetical protein n=1 Tax=Mycobacterium sp. D16R24 TaxID=1855656 RepID=UPI0009947BDA|nr:hypothetical protein [Mycobacterium sp. D16R24]
MNAPTVTVTAAADFSGRCAVRFRYDRAVVDLLKNTLDWRDREWDPQSRVWLVDPLEIDRLVRQLRSYGCEVNDQTTIHYDPPPSAATWAVAVLDAVGSERQEAVFRVLSRVLHPDAPTGDTALMRELIDGRDEVRRRAGADR